MTTNDAVARQRLLIEAVSAALGASTELFETHISWVLVSDGFAYKFKKAVRFDFLDFSTLDARRRYCDEELRLNGKLAPEIYLDVVAITGDIDRPVIDGSGPALEYAVKMRAFPQEALWSHRLEKGLLTPVDMVGLAESLARFHAGTAVAPAMAHWCTPQALQSIADETLDEIDALLEDAAEKKTAADLRAWEFAQRAALRAVFLARKDAGCVRECHGDLHGGNILSLGDRVEAFDCIEFNDGLRWIDVMNDIAFTCMDLRFHKRDDLAATFLNRYLERSGDYEGLRVLRYYEVHRALIRCKVALLRKSQCAPESEAARDAMAEASAYLAFAAKRAIPPVPAILIAHGFSGSGKSTLARALVASIDAVQLRSDVERKRMAGIPAMSHVAAGSALYGSDATQQTYAHLQQLAAIVAGAGWRVVVDATFLRRSQREPFMALARSMDIPYVILDVRASEAVMRKRLLAREQSGRDASDAGVAVLEMQLRQYDPFSEDEKEHVVTIDNERDAPAGGALASLRNLPGFRAV